MENINQDELLAQVIYNDIKTAYDDQTPEKMKQALSSAKRVINGDKSININLVVALKKLGISLVWNKVEHDNQVEKRLGVRYKNVALEI